MNPSPFREAGTVDKTEIECTRIRESEATKRHRVEQAEVTRRKKIETRKDTWVVPWFTLGGMTLFLCIAGGISYSNWLDAKYPKPASVSCVETEEVISLNNSTRSCPQGGWYEATPLAGATGQVLVHCHCTPKPADSAAPIASAHP